MTSQNKMTPMSQEEIIANTKTVIQGLEALKSENHSILNGLLSSLNAIKSEPQTGGTKARLAEEKASIIQKSIDSIELGLGEAQVRHSLGFIQRILQIFTRICLLILGHGSLGRASSANGS